MLPIYRLSHSASQAKGKYEAEQQAHKLEVALAGAGAETARKEVEKLEVELRDYKARAQVRVCVSGYAVGRKML